MPRNKSSAPEPLRRVVGRRVKAIREAAGLRQDDVASAARWYGLSWSRSRVAELENGEKPISAEDLLLLPAVLTLAVQGTRPEPVHPWELFDDDAEIALTPGVRASSRGLGAMLIRPAQDPLLPARAERVFDAARQGDAERKAAVAAYPALGSVRPKAIVSAERTVTEAESKAARRLGVTRTVVLLTAAHLWDGRSLSAERDRRLVASAIPDDAPRTVQAKRGRVTRELLAEMQTFLTDTLESPRGRR